MMLSYLWFSDFHRHNVIAACRSKRESSGIPSNELLRRCRNGFFKQRARAKSEWKSVEDEKIIESSQLREIHRVGKGEVVQQPPKKKNFFWCIGSARVATEGKGELRKSNVIFILQKKIYCHKNFPSNFISYIFAICALSCSDAISNTESIQLKSGAEWKSKIYYHREKLYFLVREQTSRALRK